MDPKAGPSWTSEPTQLLMSMTQTSKGSPRRQEEVAAQSQTGLVESFSYEEPVLSAEDLLPVDHTLAAEADLQKFVRGEISYNELEKNLNSGVRVEPVLDEDLEELDDDIEDDDEDMIDEVDGETVPVRRGRGRAKRSVLDEIGAGLLGNAELSFARGEHKDAILMVLEVIKGQPMAFEPYQTLGDFYEQLSQDDKALQYFTIAAFLSPNDGENWKYVAEKHVEQGNDLQTAIKCFDKAIKYLPMGSEQIECRMERARLYEEHLKDLSKAIEGYESVLSLCQENDGEFAVDLAKKVARLHFENKNIPLSVKVLEETFSKYQSHIASENINVYIELLITQSDIAKALSAYQEYCGVKFLDKETNEVLEKITSEVLSSKGTHVKVDLEYPDLMPIDLLSKLIVCLIILDAEASLPQLQELLLKESPDNTGDLYLDVAEAYIDKKRFEDSVIFLERLVDSEAYGCEGAVWLRFARVLTHLNQSERSIEAYKKVILHEPNHFDARLELSQQLVSMNRLTEAAETSCQTTTKEGFINLDLLSVRCKLLFQQNNFSDFIEAAKSFLVSDMILLEAEKELSCMISGASFQRKMECLKEVHKELGIDVFDQRCCYVGKDPSPEDYYEVLIRLCYVLANITNDQESLKKVVFSAYTSQSLLEKESSLDFLALMTVYQQQDKEYCFRLVKIIINKMPTNTQVWNVFCPIVSRYYQDLRHNRFCLRLFIKHPDLLPLEFFNAHNALMSGSYKHALGMSSLP